MLRPAGGKRRSIAGVAPPAAQKGWSAQKPRTRGVGRAAKVPFALSRDRRECLMMRIVVVVGILLIVGAVAFLWLRPVTPMGAGDPDAGGPVVDAVATPTPSPSPSPSPPLAPPPSAVPAAPMIACAITSWDALTLDPAPPSPTANADGNDVDDPYVGDATPGPVRLGFIKAGECAGAELLRDLVDAERGERGCIDGDRVLADGSTWNLCNESSFEDTVTRRLPARHFALAATTVTLFTKMSAFPDPAPLQARYPDKTVIIDTTSSLPGMPIPEDVTEPETPTWERWKVAYSKAHARALDIGETPCLAPREAPEGTYRRCKETLRLTRPDGVLVVYVPEPLFLPIQDYVALPLPRDLTGFGPFVGKPAATQSPDDIADDDDDDDGDAVATLGGMPREYTFSGAQKLGHEVSFPSRPVLEGMFKRAKETLRQHLPAKGAPLDEDELANNVDTDAYACRSTTCREPWETFLAMDLETYVALQPAAILRDHYGRKLYFVRVIFDLPL